MSSVNSMHGESKLIRRSGRCQKEREHSTACLIAAAELPGRTVTVWETGGVLADATTEGELA